MNTNITISWDAFLALSPGASSLPREDTVELPMTAKETETLLSVSLKGETLSDTIIRLATLYKQGNRYQ